MNRGEEIKKKKREERDDSLSYVSLSKKDFQISFFKIEIGRVEQKTTPPHVFSASPTTVKTQYSPSSVKTARFLPFLARGAHVRLRWREGTRGAIRERVGGKRAWGRGRSDGWEWGGIG